MPVDAVTLAVLVIAAVLAVVAAMCARRSGAARREGERLDRLLATSPARPLWRTADGTLSVADGAAGLLGLPRIGELAAVAGALTPESAQAFAEVLGRLEDGDDGFRLEAGLADRSRHLTITGRADGAGGVIVWLEDTTETEKARQSVVAEREAAETDLAELRAALDTLPVPIWLRRADLGIAWCNRAYARLMDATPERVVAEQRELSAAGAGGGRALAERALRQWAPQTQRLYVVADSARHHLDVTEVPLPRALPGPARTVGMALDRTDLDGARGDLKRHISAHAEVLEHLGTAVAVFGPDTRIQYYNHAYVRLGGFDEAWLRTEPTYADVLENLRERRRLPELVDFQHYKKQQLALFSSLLEAREDLLHLPDGAALRQVVAPHPLGGLLFLLDDVTNTLALESSFNTLIAVQQETLDNLAEGIAVYGGDGRMKLHNPAFARIWNLSPADLRGDPHIVRVLDRLKDFFPHGDDWETYRDDLVASTLDRTARQGRVERTDGTVVEFATVPLPDGAVLSSWLDVTDSARVEQALRASNAALEAADQLKSEFIANVSYHLRTPLTAIMGFAQVLANQYFGELNERQSEYTQHILSAGDRLLTLISDILDLATIEAGHMVLERSTVSVSSMLAVVAALTREWARKQGLELVIDCPGDLGEIEADERRLKQALFNLVSNAIRFTPSGGRITLSAQRSREVVVLSVGDTGPGLLAADPSRASRRFDRAGTGERPGETGAGLGLDLVRSFIELHGGRIVVDSDPGKGTAIHCVLPIRPATEGATRNGAGAATEGRLLG